MKARTIVRPLLLLLGVAVLVAGGFLVIRLTRHKTAIVSIPVEAAAKRNIVVTIEATGTVEPIDLVEVKSKASGQILRMPVEVGSQVKVGDLLAQIDTVDVANTYAQALATLKAAEAKVQISTAQKKRTTELFAQQVITTDELESATLDFANAQASLVKARTDLDIARQRRDDTTVRAPVAGTVLSQLVTVGQVISSATSSVSGGTSLLKMADLSRIRLRLLVAETDIGKVKVGQTATVTVDAFPTQPFDGQVEKIEPQAVVQQSVTMFPVLVSISNKDGLLLPGMNGEVSVLTDRRDDVLAIPVDAVRTLRELSALATALGMNPDSAQAEIQRESQARRSRSRTGSGTGAATATGAVGDAGGPPPDGGLGGPPPGDFVGGPPPGGGPPAGGAPGGAPGGGGSTGGFGGGRAGGFRGTRGTGSWRGSGSGGGTGSGTAAGSTGTGTTSQQIVFVKTDTGYHPRLVRTGLSDYDYTEILRGVREGESVVLLNVAEVQAKRVSDQNQLRQRLGSGVGGVPGTGTTRSSTSGSGASGTRASGAGR